MVDCIHSGIHKSLANHISVQHAYTSFMDFYRIHSVPFGKDLKEQITRAVHTIDHDFYPEEKQYPIEQKLNEVLGLS